MPLELTSADDLGRNAGNDSACRNVMSDDCPRADNGAVADGHSHVTTALAPRKTWSPMVSGVAPPRRTLAHLHSAVTEECV